MRRRQQTELQQVRQEKVASYLFDLSKLIFGATVVGFTTFLFDNELEEVTYKNYCIVIFGLISTLILALFAYKTLKTNKI